MDMRVISYIKSASASLIAALPALILFSALSSPPAAEAVPSYARQTGLSCNGCHYTPPELNAAGRRFKLMGYVDRADDTKVVKADGGKSRAALNLLMSLPLSAMFETSFTNTKSPVPTTQNGNLQVPQDMSLFLAGAWTDHIGSFLQVTYETQSDHFTSDNTDIRYANKTTMGGKELVYGLDLNNNPTVEDLWNSTPAWGYPWMASNVAPTPNATPIINGALAEDVAGFGGYAMWNNHLYFNVDAYRSQHVGGSEPNPGIGSTFNIVGVAPYWRLAWQESRGNTQFEVGTYGMHMKTTPNSINSGTNDLYDSYTSTKAQKPVELKIEEIALGYQERLGFLLENKYCAACHDPESTPERVSNYDNLEVKPHPFTDGNWLNKMGDEDLTAIIGHGGPALNKSALMPSYGSTISKADIEALISYIRLVSDPPFRSPGGFVAKK